MATVNVPVSLPETALLEQAWLIRGDQARMPKTCSLHVPLAEGQLA